MEDWQNASIGIEEVKTGLESLVQSNHITHLQALQQRTWLLHWSLFVYWNDSSTTKAQKEQQENDGGAAGGGGGGEGKETNNNSSSGGAGTTNTATTTDAAGGDAAGGNTTSNNNNSNNNKNIDAQGGGGGGGLEQLVELFHSERYKQAITTHAPHLLRYLTTAVLLCKRRVASAANSNSSSSSSSSTGNSAQEARRLLRNLVAVMQDCEYTDPIVEFVNCLCVKFDFDMAQAKLAECSTTDFVLYQQTKVFMEEALHSLFCLIGF